MEEVRLKKELELKILEQETKKKRMGRRKTKKKR